jgi:predicted dehydrogenase
MQQRRTCAQEEHIAAGLKPLDPGFGAEPPALDGILTTVKEFDPKVQAYDEATKKYSGKYPTASGRWMGLYENLADAINGKAELQVKAVQSRDVLRIIELARESHNTGRTVEWR